MRGYTALARMGLHPRFITEDQLAHGPPPPASVLILPHSIVLSDQEIRTIAGFAAKGGEVIADTPPGQFDGHGRRRTRPSLPVRIISPKICRRP